MKEHNEQMDTLTGLPNITYFRRLSQKVLDDPTERAKGLVFIYFDVKNFRAFNYHYGFDVGDHLIMYAGNIIKKTFPELHVSRFADDHFLVVAYNSDIERRLSSIRNKITNFQKNSTLILKAGVYVVPTEKKINSVQAYDCAKLACESVKDISDVHIGYYSDKLGEREKLREHIIETVDLATQEKYIQVYYQPIVHVYSRRVCGYEGLARWQDPEFGLLSPADFIGTLEDSRLIQKLDVFMIRKICSDLKSWQDAGLPLVPVSVNLSPLDFQMVNMPFIAEEALRVNRLPKNLLSIEVTESAFAQGYKEVQRALERFRKIGFEIWVDNFGSKYSSLNVLEEVDADLLKIDMRFLKNFHTEPRSRSILKNIIHMAKELGLRTLMEGVETEEVMEFLRQTGCEEAQGYLFGRPTHFEELKHEERRPETYDERIYYNAIGRVNLLSQSPLKTGWSTKTAEENLSATLGQRNNVGVENLNFMLNGLPLAIAEYDGKRFNFLMANPTFRKIFKNLAVSEKFSTEDVFNNFTLQFALKVHNLAQRCIKTGEEGMQDFLTSDGFHNIRLRCIAYNNAANTAALLAVVEKVGENVNLRRNHLRDAALRFLYMLYSRVDLLKMDGTDLENIYINSSRYRDSFVKGSVKQSIENFAERNVYVEDREKFIKFFDLETITERLWEFNGLYITDYFRTRNSKQNFTWQMYMLIPIVHQGEKYLLSCVRNVDLERMKRLPEIDRMGSRYYDMPGNPIFLLLASRALTSTLGYGTFDSFLQNSLYIEANLTAERVLYMHLGEQGIVSDHHYELMTYDEVIRDMILNTVLEDNHMEVANFFDCQRLLEDYSAGKVIGEMEFLRRPDPKSKPRYLHTAYQLRESGDTNDIHAYFLSFDIDAFRRTNEAMVELIERDNLTGLYNRGTAVSLVRKYLSSSKQAAFVILDLDNFKQINDRLGHDCGDMIIKDAAARMSEAFGDNGIVARIGGDEFLVLLKDLPNEEVDKLLKKFSDSKKSVQYKDAKITFTMSIGYASFPDQGKEYHDLYQNADMALYSVKMSGRNSFKKFSDYMIQNNRSQLGFSLAQISEGMPGGFLIYRDNENLDILYANTRLLQIYECESMDEFRKFTGNSFRGCIHEDDWESIADAIDVQVKFAEGYDYVQYRARTAKGNIRIIEDFGRRVNSPEYGDIFYVFVIDMVDKEKVFLNRV